MRSARAILYLVLFSFIFLLFSPLQVAAQTPANYQTSPAASIESFRAPNVDPDVPRNQHTYAQTTTIEVLSAVYCILTGIDPIDPTLGCVGVNPETRRLGMSKPTVDQYGRTEITGLIGATSGMIGSTFEPIASTGTFTNYLSDSFGIVKSAHAQAAPCDPAKSGYGFCGLVPILKLWETVRNVAYALLTIAFILIGVGIMLRVKIDPRTVMSIQNQIPKVVISIILITLSYGIAALMVDTMWVSTYAGTYLLTTDRDPFVGDCTKQFNNNPNDEAEKLSKKATTTILQTPFTYFNQIFARCSKENNFPGLSENDRDGGFHTLSRGVADNVGETIGNVGRSLIFDENDEETKCKWYHPIKCAKKGVINVFAVLVSLVVLIVIFVILVITMFRIWFALFKAYIYSLIYILAGPLYIVFGLLPTKPLGFEKWLRGVFVNLAIFPITVYLFIVARLLMDLYKDPTSTNFIPPLVGSPVANTNFGALLAFFVILMIPNAQTILREKMGVKGIGSPGLIAGAIAGGAGVVGGPVSRAYKHLNRHDNSGHAVGALAVGKDMAGEKVLDRLSKSKFNPVANSAKRRIEERHAAKNSGYESVDWKRREVREAYRDKNHKFWGTQQGIDIIAKNHGEIPLGYRGRRNAKNGGGEGEAETRVPGRKGLKFWKRRRGDEPPAPTGAAEPSTSPTSGAGGAAITTIAGGAGGAETKGSVHTAGDGNITITGPVTATGHVTSAGGGNAGEAKQKFISKKVDEYVDKLKAKGESGTASAKRDITIRLVEEELEKKGPADLAQMHEPEWKKLIKDAEEKEEKK